MARMTAQQFRALPEANQFVELLCGEIVVSPSPVRKHQRAIVALITYLTRAVPKGEFLVAPMSVHLDDENIPEPDIFWVSGPDSKCKLGEDGYFYGAPDLVIEVLSPSTARSDRRIKFQVYQQYGVREYWLVDPEAKSIEVWRLIDQEFVFIGVFGTDTTFVSTVLFDLTVNVSAALGE